MKNNGERSKFFLFLVWCGMSDARLSSPPSEFTSTSVLKMDILSCSGKICTVQYVIAPSSGNISLRQRILPSSISQFADRNMSPMVFMCFFVLCFVMGSYRCSEVVVLDTSNFEKLTQASTGHTTGDWFVKV